MLLNLLFVGCVSSYDCDDPNVHCNGRRSESSNDDDSPTDTEEPSNTGMYNLNPCPDEVTSTGNALGQIARDFELQDQFGDTVVLSNFCGNTVLLVSAWMFSGYCNEKASLIESWYQQYKNDGLTVITLLGLNEDSTSPNQEDLQLWAERHGLTHPVVADSEMETLLHYLHDNPEFDEDNWGVPNMQLLSPGMVVQISNNHNINPEDFVGFFHSE